MPDSARIHPWSREHFIGKSAHFASSAIWIEELSEEGSRRSKKVSL